MLLAVGIQAQSYGSGDRMGEGGKAMGMGMGGEGGEGGEGGMGMGGEKGSGGEKGMGGEGGKGKVRCSAYHPAPKDLDSSMLAPPVDHRLYCGTRLALGTSRALR